MQITTIEGPCEVFPMWHRAQREVERHARTVPPPSHRLRTEVALPPELAERVADWFTGRPWRPTTRSGAPTARFGTTPRGCSRSPAVASAFDVRYVHGEGDPYDSAAELCAELRERGSMTLTTIACEDPHPLLGGAEGGVVDQLRVVHDVFGHAALGLGFDLQSEIATWLQCETLFSPEARPAAFCELVGAVTAYVTTGSKPGLRADVPPAELLSAVSGR